MKSTYTLILLSRALRGHKMARLVLGLLILGVTAVIPTASFIDESELIEIAVVELNTRPRYSNLYYFSELKEKKEMVSEDGHEVQLMFTIKETNCRKSTRQEAKTCKFKQGGVSI
ncbi:cathelicidin-2-like [Protopterus annectens]|uniref:cathelicidin-2-like n=1 Tax=Protopterus annectens TaxID=7888 RepID=UPI001CF9D5F3|nr:cathelicidin-2-like [Protopterus annectens]